MLTRRGKLLGWMLLLQAYVILLYICVAGYVSDYSIAIADRSKSISVRLGDGTVGFGCNINSNIANLNWCVDMNAIEHALPNVCRRTDPSETLLLKRARSIGYRYQADEGWSASFCNELPIISSGVVMGVLWKYSAGEGFLRWHYVQVELPAWVFGVVPTIVLFWRPLLFQIVPSLGFLLYRTVLWQTYGIQQRARQGRCRSCGYDLRATPHQCPECGLVTSG